MDQTILTSNPVPPAVDDEDFFFEVPGIGSVKVNEAQAWAIVGVIILLALATAYRMVT